MIVYRIPEPIAATPLRHRRACAVSLAGTLRTGALAGAGMLGLLLLLAITVYDESPWKLLRMVAAIALGPAALDPESQFDLRVLATALLLQFAMATAAAAALGRAAARFSALPSAALGLAFGAVLYGVDLYGLAIAFPWLAQLRSADTLLVHLLFGLLAIPAAE